MTIHNEVYGVDADSSSFGAPIAIASVTAPGQLLHTATSDPDTFDEIWLWGTNNSIGVVLLSIYFGGVIAADLITANIPTVGSGPWCVIPGWRLRSGVPVYGFASASGVVNVSININRTVKITT